MRGYPWSPEEDAELARWVKAGWGDQAIATKLETRRFDVTPSAVAHRRRYLGLMRKRGGNHRLGAANNPRDAKCTACTSAFTSRGPHNRLCPKCTAKLRHVA